MTKKHSWLTPAVITLFLLSVVMGSYEFSVVGILWQLADFYEVSISMAGYLVTIFAVTLVFGAPTMMILTSKMNRYRIMFLAMIVFIATTIVTILIPSYWVMFFGRMIIALVCGSIVSCSYVLSMEVVPKEDTVKSMTMVFAGYSISSVVIIPIIIVLSAFLDWRYSYCMILAMEIICLILLTKYIPRTSQVYEGNKEEMKAYVHDKRIILSIVMPLFAVGGIYVVYSYITPIMINSFGFNEDYMPILLLIYGFMCVISNYFSSKVESKGGMRMLKYVFSIQAFILIGFTFVAVFMSDNVLLGIFMMMMVGLVMYVINTPLQTYYLNVAKQDYPGAVYLSSSFQPMAFNLGVATGSFVGGHIIMLVGYANLGFIGGMMSLIAVALMIIFGRIEKNRPSETT